MMHADAIESRSLRPLLRTEYERLVELGCFEDERLELLNGFLVRMSPQKAPHATAVSKLTELLVPACLGRARVRIQLPLIAGDDSEPEPDAAIVDLGDYSEEHPATALLVIEVADSSLPKDREVKAPLYAAAGIPEYWIVNLDERCVEVCRDPFAGRYRTAFTVAPDDRVRCVALPQVDLLVADLLP